ncbi:SMI1/KNR4 family protein [Stenotrophomonas maltophilia]|uniref:SMI1/KNR4 family protein n=1 Tax=Stenotrophomonas maltophilia TaxID=40324 RepID=UPI00066BECC6|nr:SMI1/KNR4 family protein [Stenotrophomonas maltophilia]MBH1463954.1 SMI1/KNR4 family protein [Stenotrophomonas maltophilia]MBH1612392.1 SMI1/KNR4 family protein [Stenotrophomonas maltophilia]MBN5166553.1 SMI1/KNR4 family protein [Stenotrophomonas maltophilia]
MKLIGQAQQLTRQDLCEFSDSTGLRLPREFVDFYLENNGGYPDVEPDEANPLLLNSFLPIRYGDATIEAAYQRLMSGNPALEGLVPFAYDDCGNVFLLFGKPGMPEEVFLWLPGEKELEAIFSSFAEFLHALYGGKESR